MRAATLLLALACSASAHAADGAVAPWWIWPLALFALSFALGAVSVLAGVGGGVLFVPIVGGFFPFHLDFVRGAGLLLALASSLAASPVLLRNGLANLRLALPLALVASIAAIAGALLGLALPVAVVETALGVVVLGIAGVMWLARRSESPAATSDRLGAALRLHGVFHDPALARDVEWRVQRTPLGIATFACIGLLAGMFGLGAGWANVPTLNLLLGLPLKLSVGTSGFLLSVVDTAAAWVYLQRGAVLPILVAPSVLGVMLGARLGVRFLGRAPAAVVRRLVIALLLVAGARALLKGLGAWN